MNCTECKEHLVAYVEGLLTESQKQAVESHLHRCPACRTEADQLIGLRDRLVANGKTLAQTDLENKVLNQILKEQSLKLRQTQKHINQFQLWRTIMKSRITKLAAAAAVIIIAVVLSITFLDKSIPTASAAEILAKAAKAVSNLHSIYIKARMRTLPSDNFSLIELEHDFVPIELWKKVDDSGLVKWKVEKPGRLLVMDGSSTTFFVRPNFVRKSRPTPYIRGYDCGWLGRIVNVKDLIESEYKYVREAKNTELVINHEIVHGRGKLILEVYASAQGDYTNDYLKNAFLDTSDHTKIYQFDAETKLLEGFEIVVHTDQNDILVFEVTDIEYDPQIDDKVFALDLPDNLIYSKEPEILPDNEKYQNMGPKEAAAAVFNACAKEDWDEFLKFSMTSGVHPGTKDILGGLEVISIGEPFTSGPYPGLLVPYEIRLKDGTVRKHNLALKKHPKVKRYVIDGGI